MPTQVQARNNKTKLKSGASVIGTQASTSSEVGPCASSSSVSTPSSTSTSTPCVQEISTSISNQPVGSGGCLFVCSPLSVISGPGDLTSQPSSLHQYQLPHQPSQQLLSYHHQQQQQQQQQRQQLLNKTHQISQGSVTSLSSVIIASNPSSIQPVQATQHLPRYRPQPSPIPSDKPHSQSPQIQQQQQTLHIQMPGQRIGLTQLSSTTASTAASNTVSTAAPTLGGMLSGSSVLSSTSVLTSSSTGLVYSQRLPCTTQLQQPLHQQQLPLQQQQFILQQQQHQQQHSSQQSQSVQIANAVGPFTQIGSTNNCMVRQMTGPHYSPTCSQASIGVTQQVIQPLHFFELL
ncbi:unnamed protein product [Protopolystoma xenopodis]|uniref:Uncharacterized protein n=1 Tax=Protopolystoma xenopodis TaxID=117903 RepID=A0A448WZ41_9PLAT|nr:unnamed protein product [Protopolystoma xenopodis]